jgi:hypothetical protein
LGQELAFRVVGREVGRVVRKMAGRRVCRIL